MAIIATVGELRVAAPIGFARLIAEALGPLLNAHPRLSLHLLLDDAPTDLVAERVDLALRVGDWADSSLVARRIGSLAMVIVAAPVYLARRSLPQHPQALLEHDWLLPKPRGLELHSPGEEAVQAVRLSARVVSDNHLCLQQMCVAGLGMAAMALPDVAEGISSGRLVRVLPDWSSADFGVYAVTLRRDAQPAKVRHALKALRSALGGGNQAPEPPPAAEPEAADAH